VAGSTAHCKAGETVRIAGLASAPRTTAHATPQPVSGGLGLKPILVVNPVSDAAFVELANALIADGTSTPASLQSRLRDRYPRAVVRPRTLSGEPIEIWYVYRDGYWVRADQAFNADSEQRA
jgi:hypothetical protein